VKVAGIFQSFRKKGGGNSIMIIVPIKEGENIERALKKFKRKFEKTGKSGEDEGHLRSAPPAA